MQVVPEEIGQKLQEQQPNRRGVKIVRLPTFKIGALISNFGFSSDAAHKQFQGIASSLPSTLNLTTTTTITCYWHLTFLLFFPRNFVKKYKQTTFFFHVFKFFSSKNPIQSNDNNRLLSLTLFNDLRSMNKNKTEKM